MTDDQMPARPAQTDGEPRTDAAEGTGRDEAAGGAEGRALVESAIRDITAAMAASAIPRLPADSDVFAIVNGIAMAGALAALPHLNGLVAERDELRGKVAAVRALHVAVEGRCTYCVTWCACDAEIAHNRALRHGDNLWWPCPTIQALGGEG